MHALIHPVPLPDEFSEYREEKSLFSMNIWRTDKCGCNGTHTCSEISLIDAIEYVPFPCGE